MKKGYLDQRDSGVVMRYVEGKARIAKWIRDHILAVADEYRGVPLTYVEPFVGSGAVLEQIVRTKRFARHIANDTGEPSSS